MSWQKLRGPSPLLGNPGSCWALPESLDVVPISTFCFSSDYQYNRSQPFETRYSSQKTWARPHLRWANLYPPGPSRGNDVSSPHHHPATRWPLLCPPRSCWRRIVESDDWQPFEAMTTWRNEEAHLLQHHQPQWACYRKCVCSSSLLLLISSSDSQHHGNKNTSFSTVSAAKPSVICCNELSLFFMLSSCRPSLTTISARCNGVELFWDDSFSGLSADSNKTFTVWKHTLISFVPISSRLNTKVPQSRAETINRIILSLKNFDTNYLCRSSI